MRNLKQLNEKIKHKKSEITDETFEIEYDDLKNIDLAYCITVHCAQGSTFDLEYSIYEWQHFDSRMMYVAISSAIQRSYVNFCDVDCQLQEGFIYKITNQLTNK